MLVAVLSERHGTARRSRHVDKAEVTNSVLSPLRNTLYYLRQDGVIHEETPAEMVEGYYAAHDPLQKQPHPLVHGAAAPHVARELQPPSLKRRTIQVADLHRHLEAAHVQRAILNRTCPMCASNTRVNSDSGRALPPLAGVGNDVIGQRSQDEGSGAAASQSDDLALNVTAEKGALSPPQLDALACCDQDALSREKQRANALYKAAVIADQNVKLSIFATRPAIYSPVYNFIAEVMGTTVLILLVLLVEMQARRFPEGSDMKLMYEVGIQYIVICFIVVVLIAGLGGPTAYAANPARDLGPRLAHALLPIPGKGPSEWCYAWVPVLAPLVGGALAGVLYIGIEEMQFPEGGSRGGGLFVG